MQILFLLLSAVGVFSFDLPCKKLYFFGNNIQNKALLSPIVILGKSSMKIPLENNLYKATIEIISLLKGSLGDWNKNILIAGEFSNKNDSTNLCQFQSQGAEIKIYFLEVGTAKNGEYKVLFDVETPTKENLDMINKTICKGCVEPPKLFIKYKILTENITEIDCISESKPSPIIKWNHSVMKSNMNATELRNGARLTLTSSRKTNEMLVCTGANILGESTASFINPTSNKEQIDGVSRCAINDKLLCNGNGKCYKDKIDDGKMFCRCDPGYTGSRCSNNPNKLSSEYLLRSPETDEKYCDKNGKGYINVKTKQQLCLCNDGFYGERCSIKAVKVAEKPLKQSSETRKSNNVPIKDKEELRKMIDDSNSKLAVKYIIIGATIVLAGCIIVILVIIIVFRCFYVRSQNTYGREEILIKRKNQQCDVPSKSLPNFEHGTIYLPPKNDYNKVPTNTKPPAKSNGDQRINEMNDFSGNGIYEGVNIPLDRDYLNRNLL